MDKRQRRLNLLKGDKRGDDPADGPVGNGLLLGDQALVFADDLRVLGAGVQRAQTINTRPDDVGRSLWVGCQAAIIASYCVSAVRASA